MLYHCGLLSDRPDKDRTLSWIRRGYWETGLPDDVWRELRIWLAMPGFSIYYHMKNFQVGKLYLMRFIGGFDQWEKEVAANWLSATWDDCVKLARLRPYKGMLPLICKLSILDDLKANPNQSQLAAEYHVTRRLIYKLRIGQLTGGERLPIGFKLLVPNHREWDH